MRVVVAASGGRDWRRRLGFRQAAEVPTLLWVEGPHALSESHYLSALLSEQGIPNRWLPLYKRPTLLREALSLPWPQTQLYAYLQQVPFLVLSDQEVNLKSLWISLQNQGVIQETLFMVRHYKHPLFQEGAIVLPSEKSVEWITHYEDLRPDLQAAASWQPCKLIPVLS